METRVARALHHLVVVAATFATAVSGVFGAVGMATGWMPIGPRLEARLPLQSPVVGASALLLVVAVPAVVLAVEAWHDTPHLGVLVTGFGWLLIGWIAVELAFLRSLSFLHVLIALAGVAFVVAGRRLTASSRRVMSRHG